jgi:hypothetical protein
MHIRSLMLPIALMTTITACGAPAEPATPPSPPVVSSRANVERLLDQSDIESILAPRAGAFSRQVALLVGDVTDAELERLVPAVQRAFEPSSLRDSVASFMEREEEGGSVTTVLEWQTSGANAEARRIAGAYDPPLTLDAYTRSLMTDPPGEDRIRVMVEWAESQGAGELFVLLDEALTEAAYAVWTQFRADAPSFTPTAGAELQTRLTDSFNASMVTLLRSYESVPDSVVRAATAEYSSDAGQWYVQTYSLAVAEAVRAAGQRVVIELRAPSL